MCKMEQNKVNNSQHSQYLSIFCDFNGRLRFTNSQCLIFLVTRPSYRNRALARLVCQIEHGTQFCDNTKVSFRKKYINLVHKIVTEKPPNFIKL